MAPDRIAAGSVLAWPGIAEPAFLRATDRLAGPRQSEWMFATVNTLLGATLIWVVSRTAYPGRPLLAGWLGMVGLILALHFGTFHLLSLAWRRRGVDAAPVMHSPLLASSLADFWGRRWNTSFHALAARFAFRPLRPAFGATGRDAGGLSRLGPRARTGDLRAGAQRLRIAHNALAAIRPLGLT